MHGSFAAIVGVDKCSGLIELDYEYAMMRELCMYACVGLCITCCCVCDNVVQCIRTWGVWVICGIRRCLRVSTRVWACLWFYIDD